MILTTIRKTQLKFAVYLVVLRGSLPFKGQMLNYQSNSNWPLHWLAWQIRRFRKIVDFDWNHSLLVMQ